MRTPQRLRRGLLVLVLVALTLPLPVPAQANHLVTERGYIPVAVGTPDETTLHYRVTLPDAEVWGHGPYPAVVDYSGYIPAITIYDGLDHRFLEHGYAVVGLNMRGSACSGGKFDYFEPLQSTDGAEAIEWLAQQPWSNGRLGMVGKSYPGITQLFVAAEQPEALKAIVPGHVFGDLYRDVPFPGGIMNLTFAAAWSANRVVEGYVTGPQWWSEQGDEQCLANQADHVPNLAFNPFVQALYNQYDGPLFQERSPWYFADRITAPTFLINAWQDEQVGSRSTNLVERFNPDLSWKFLATNGDHGEYYGPEVFPRIIRFLSYYLKQEIPVADSRTVTETVEVEVPGKGRKTRTETVTITRPETFEEALAAYEAEDPVIINWENGALGGRDSAWTETYSSWPPAETTPWRLYLHSDGRLTEEDHATGSPETRLEALNARLAGAVDYTYAPVVGTQARGGHRLTGNVPHEASWSDRPAPGTFAAFETEPLAADKVLLGSASVDLYMASTAPDTDLQVTLSEIRPDGQEMFVQQGWLRASHRHEESTYSTELRPYHGHRLGDTAPLLAGQPTKLRIEVFPFGHVFRAGSRLRISVEAPHTQPDLWGFAVLPLPATNTIFTSAFYPSSVALPLIDGAAAAAGIPPCTLRNQPCR